MCFFTPVTVSLLNLWFICPRKIKNVFESWSSVQCWPSVVLQEKNYSTLVQIIWAMCKYYPFHRMCMGSKSPWRLSTCFKVHWCCLRSKRSGTGCLGFSRLCGFWACFLQYRRQFWTEAHLGKTASRPRSPGATSHYLFARGTICHMSAVPQQPPTSPATAPVFLLQTNACWNIWFRN